MHKGYCVMQKKRVFIDGRAGTTGLRIFERLQNREDVELILLSEEMRKDENARRDALNSSDFSFLCLPDDAARQAVSLVTNQNTVIIDASTAHRTADGWAYGLPELGEKYRARVAGFNRIAVPGCHASGFIALVQPLVSAGIIPADALLSAYCVTGYSGGGKKMIADYECHKTELMESPGMYGLTQEHKHLKEMRYVSGIENFPVFCPVVADIYSGMHMSVPLFRSQINGTANDIKEIYKNLYTGRIVRYCESIDDNNFIYTLKNSGKDSMLVSVTGNEERILLTAVYDNLGKGASGAAIECFNIRSGCDEETGLIL